MLSPEFRYAGLLRGLEQIAKKDGNKAIAKKLEIYRNDLLSLVAPCEQDPKDIISAVDIFLRYVFNGDESDSCLKASQMIQAELKLVK